MNLMDVMIKTAEHIQRCLTVQHMHSKQTFPIAFHPGTIHISFNIKEKCTMQRIGCHLVSDSHFLGSQRVI